MPMAPHWQTRREWQFHSEIRLEPVKPTDCRTLGRTCAVPAIRRARALPGLPAPRRFAVERQNYTRTVATLTLQTHMLRNALGNGTSTSLRYGPYTSSSIPPTAVG